MKQRAMLIVNPSSGKEKAVEYSKQAADILEVSHSYVSVRYTEKQDDAFFFAAEACEKRYDTLIAMGGDGTINEVINGLAEQKHKPVFGFVPLGTVNDFARALHIPLQPEKAIALLKEQYTKNVDIGKIGKRYFMNVLAVGLIAEAVYDVTPEEKSKYGALAYMMEGAKAYKNKTPFRLTMTYDSQSWDGDAYLVLIALTNSVAGMEKLAEGAEVNDHLFHIFIVKDLSFPSMFTLLPSAMSGKLKNNNKIDYLTARRMDLQADEELVVNIDGDEGVKLPFHAEVLPEELQIIVPGEY